MLSRNVFALIVALVFASASCFAQSGEDPTKTSGSSAAAPSQLRKVEALLSAGRNMFDIRITPSGVSSKAAVYIGGKTACNYQDKIFEVDDTGRDFVLVATGFPENESRFSEYCRGQTMKITLPKGGGLAVVDGTSPGGSGFRGTFRY